MPIITGCTDQCRIGTLQCMGSELQQCKDIDGDTCMDGYFTVMKCSEKGNWDEDNVNCNCDCGGYDIIEKWENNNCKDGKDNDCDGRIDGEERRCDIVSPDIEISHSRKNPIDNVKIEVIANDDKSKIDKCEISIDNGIYEDMRFISHGERSKLYKKYRELENGEHLIDVRCFDRAGNWNNEMYTFFSGGLIVNIVPKNMVIDIGSIGNVDIIIENYLNERKDIDIRVKLSGKRLIIEPRNNIISDPIKYSLEELKKEIHHKKIKTIAGEKIKKYISIRQSIEGNYKFNIKINSNSEIIKVNVMQKGYKGVKTPELDIYCFIVVLVMCCIAIYKKFND